MVSASEEEIDFGMSMFSLSDETVPIHEEPLINRVVWWANVVDSPVADKDGPMVIAITVKDNSAPPSAFHESGRCVIADG